MTDATKSIINYVIARLGESSTWRGVVLALTGAGIAISPDQAAKITAIGLGVVGIINIFREGPPTKSQVADALAAKQDKPPQ